MPTRKYYSLRIRPRPAADAVPPSGDGNSVRSGCHCGEPDGQWDRSYKKSNLWKCWGILALFSAIYALVGLLFLEMIDKDKR